MNYAYIDDGIKIEKTASLTICVSKNVLNTISGVSVVLFYKLMILFIRPTYRVTNQLTESTEMYKEVRE